MKNNTIVVYFKAAPRFELGIEDLQSTALPLGHTAIVNFIFWYLYHYSIFTVNLVIKIRIKINV